jgi:hypothetical protein
MSSPGSGKRLQLEQRAGSALVVRAVRRRNDARSLAMRAEFVRIQKIPAHATNIRPPALQSGAMARITSPLWKFRRSKRPL